VEIEVAKMVEAIQNLTPKQRELVAKLVEELGKWAARDQDGDQEESESSGHTGEGTDDSHWFSVGRRLKARGLTRSGSTSRRRKRH